MQKAEAWDPDGYGSTEPSGYDFFEGAGGTVGRRFPDGREEQVFYRDCPDGASGAMWVDVSVTIDDVVDDAVGRARRAIPEPVIDMNPAPEAGGIVNVGLWLAIEPPAPITVRAEAGALWAEATVTLASTAWDFGNGDSVTCEGPGTPIVDLDQVEQGPCGYTYRTSSPDDAPYVLGTTATWDVSYQSSAGPGTAGTIDRTATVDYDVDEIQTIGVSN